MRKEGWGGFTIAALILSGCATTTWHPEGADPAAACPVIHEYPVEITRGAADELRACGKKCEKVKIMLKDYLVLRDQLRIAHGG